MIESKTTTPFNCAYGSFELQAIAGSDGLEHAVLISGRPQEIALPWVRIQSACLTGVAFHASLCDCRQQLELGLEMLASAGSGMLIYLSQEGRGHGLVEKVAQLELIAGGLDTVDAARNRGVMEDPRRYEVAAAIVISILGRPGPIRLATNNPHKVDGVVAAGVEVGETIAIETEPTDGNIDYLRVKKQRMGHRLNRV